MVGVNKHGSRRISHPDLLEDPAILHLGKATATDFTRSRHAENAGAGEAINQVTGNVGIAINPIGIEFAIEHFPHVGQCRL